MRSCEEYQEWASCLIDGELDAASAGELRRHAAQCADCRAVLEAFTALSGGMEELQAEPPAALHENVMAELRRENRKPVLLFTPRRRTLTAAAMLAVVLLSGLAAVYRNRADKAAGGLTMAAVTADEVTEEPAESYAAEEAEVEMFSMPAAAQMAPESAQNAMRADTAAGAAKHAMRTEAASEDSSEPAESEAMELTAAQAEILLSALGEETDARAAGEPLRLHWTDAGGTAHTAALFDAVCTVDGTNYTLTQAKTALIEKLTR